MRMAVGSFVVIYVCATTERVQIKTFSDFFFNFYILKFTKNKLHRTSNRFQLRTNQCNSTVDKNKCNV